MNSSERRPQAAALAAPKPGALADRIAIALLVGQIALPSVEEWHQLAEAESPDNTRAVRDLVARWLELQNDAEALRNRQIRKAMAQGVA